MIIRDEGGLIRDAIHYSMSFNFFISTITDRDDFDGLSNKDLIVEGKDFYFLSYSFKPNKITIQTSAKCFIELTTSPIAGENKVIANWNPFPQELFTSELKFVDFVPAQRYKLSIIRNYSDNERFLYGTIVFDGIVKRPVQ